MYYDRVHTAADEIEDGFYLIVDKAHAPGGFWVFRVKTQPEDAKSWHGKQLIAYARGKHSRTFTSLAVLHPDAPASAADWMARGVSEERAIEIAARDMARRDGPFLRQCTFRDPAFDQAIMAAMRRLLADETREEAGQMYARKFGRCRICNRKLTHPDSVATGIGPECAGTRKHQEL